MRTKPAKKAPRGKSPKKAPRAKSVELIVRPPLVPLGPGNIARKRAFLAAIARTATVKAAARAARVDRTLHYYWLKDPLYAAAFAAAREQAIEILEDEAVRRAHDGTQEPVYYQGEEVGYVLRYSDTLLMFLLRGWRPERYGARTELSGPGGGPIPIEPRAAKLAELFTTDELELMRDRLKDLPG